MFGGVGIPSAKGTGTNGYVERALGYLPKDYKPGSYGEIIRQMKSNPAPIKRKINDEIILHEEKHKVEVELYDMREKYLKEKKYTAKEIEEKINRERKRLYHLLERREADFMDKNETHQKGKLKDAQMKIIKDALKIKDDYYLGEGFEYGLQADENKRKKKSKKEHKSKKDDKKKIKKHHKDENRRRHESKISDDEETDRKYSNDDSYDERDHERRRDRDRERYRRVVYRDNISRSPSPSRSRSRSRSRSKSYNKNIKKALNSDYRLNKKYKLTESVFKRSPSPVINDKEKEEKEDKDKQINEKDNKKIEKEDKNEKNKIEKEKEKGKEINNGNDADVKEKIVKNDEETKNKKLNENNNDNEKKGNEAQEKKDIIDDEHEEGSINE